MRTLVAHLDRDARLGGGHRRAERLLGAVDVRHRAVLVRLDRRRRRRVEQPRERAFASAHERVVGATPAATGGGGTAMPVVQLRAPPASSWMSCHGLSWRFSQHSRACAWTRPSSRPMSCSCAAARPRFPSCARRTRTAGARCRRGEAGAPRPPPPISVCSKVLPAHAFGGGFHHRAARS